MTRLIGVLCALVLPVAGADAQWERLKTLRPGEKIWIQYMQGDKLKREKADMAAWTEDSLAIRRNKSEVVLSRQDVRKVAVYAGKNHLRGAGAGALIGGGLGAGIFGLAWSRLDDPEVAGAAAGAAAILFGAVGGIVGAAVGTTRTEVIYEAR